MLLCDTHRQIKMHRRTLFLSVLAVSLMLLQQASATVLAPVYSKDGAGKKGGQGSNGGHDDDNAANNSNSGDKGKQTNKQSSDPSQIQIQASGKVSGGSLDGAFVKVEVNAKFATDGTFKEGRIQIKIQKADTKIELRLPATSDSHLHPPATGDHTGLSGCEVPNPSAHIVSMGVTALTIQIIGGTSTSHVALQGLSPILGSYSDLLCLSGMTQIAGK